MVSQVGFNNVPATTFTADNRCVQNGDELSGCLLARDKNIDTTENGNYYKKTNRGKMYGTVLGALAPILTKVLGVMKNGGALSGIFGKTLLISCPALAAAGFGVGALIDHITNTKRAQNADEDVVAQQQNNNVYLKA